MDLYAPRRGHPVVGRGIVLVSQGGGQETPGMLRLGVIATNFRFDLRKAQN
jgi:hypothetical protein